MFTPLLYSIIRHRSERGRLDVFVKGCFYCLTPQQREGRIKAYFHTNIYIPTHRRKHEITARRELYFTDGGFFSTFHTMDFTKSRNSIKTNSFTNNSRTSGDILNRNEIANVRNPGSTRAFPIGKRHNSTSGFNRPVDLSDMAISLSPFLVVSIAMVRMTSFHLGN